MEKAGRTHRAIREHLETDDALRRYSIDTFLQGSYKNSTNVRGDSDVDMGSLTTKVFHYKTNWLPTKPRLEYGQMIESMKDTVERSMNSLGSGSFSFAEYRADVFASLRRKYGNSVEDGNKAIKVKGSTYRLDADVLPSVAFRQYYSAGSAPSYHSGITFFANDGRQHVNFPHQHFTNLSEKDQRKKGKVKDCIRIVKRLRNEFEDAGEWERSRSPSYYLEGLMWNVPDQHYEGSHDVVLHNALKYLWDDLSDKKQHGGLDSYAQANNVFVLFHPEFWDVDNALKFIWNIGQAAYGGLR